MSPAPGLRVGVLADDLIWASRLIGAVELAGAIPVTLRTEHDLRVMLEASALEEPAREGIRERVVGVVVDLNGRRYDGVAAVQAAASAALPVICVGQHEDLELRSRALRAGATRVFTYNAFFRQGAVIVGRWLGASASVPTKTAEAPGARGATA
ncbi:MAG: hypothetical protein H0X16_05455 [Chloroflexi bacterium]|nr:hypothetical protein [Chloroflexota bacterium]